MNFCSAVIFSKLVGKKADDQLLFLLIQLGLQHLRNCIPGSNLSKGFIYHIEGFSWLKIITSSF